MTRKSRDHGLLHKFEFPPYQVRSLNDDTLIISGGGGACKSGIPNRIEVIRLTPVVAKTGQELPVVEVLASLDTDDKAIMTFDTFSMDKAAILLAAEDDTCVEYLINQSQDTESGDHSPHDDAVDGLRQRVEGKESRESKKDGCSIASFPMRITRLRTCPDALGDGEENHNPQLINGINVVRLNRTGDFGVLAGAQGKVRLLERTGGKNQHNGQAYNMKVSMEFKASAGAEVDDMDLSPDGNYLATVCSNPEGKYSKLWRVKDGSLITELALNKLTKIAYRFKHCRFGRVPGQSTNQVENAVLLHTTHTSVVRQRKPEPSYLSVWLCREHDCQITNVINIGVEIPSCLSVSDSGRHVAVGTLEGSVSVFSLASGSVRRVYHLPQAHPIFVTDVELLPVVRPMKTKHDFEAVSVSADNMLRWHAVKSRDLYYFSWRMVILFVLFILILNMIGYYLL